MPYAQSNYTCNQPFPFKVDSRSFNFNMQSALANLALLLLVSISLSFRCYPTYTTRLRISLLQSLADDSSENAGPSRKGFGAAPVKKVADIEEKDAGTQTYEKQAKRGVPEYNVFLRPEGSDETAWVPVGSMTIPRDTPVEKAVYDVEAELLKGTFKLYPKLRAFYEMRGGGKEENKDKVIFEYGYTFKAFPDEQITVMKRPSQQQENKNFFTNWLGRLTSPIDTSDLKNKGELTLKQ